MKLKLVVVVLVIVLVVLPDVVTSHCFLLFVNCVIKTTVNIVFLEL